MTKALDIDTKRAASAQQDALLSEVVVRLKPSATNTTVQKARKLKAAGRDMVSLSTGEPDFDTPENVIAAALDAMKVGQTKYALVARIPDLKAAVRYKFLTENGLEYADDEMMVS
jgi:aspartate aminotransferase